MLAKVNSCALVGLEGALVEVEVDLARGLPGINIVGLPDEAVAEAKERVRAAIKNSGFEFPPQRITVNLAPADLRKAGAAYDFPIAMGILLAVGEIAADTTRALLLGELSLDGSLRHTRGVLSMAGFARDKGFTQLFLPACDAAEAALVEGINVFPAEHLAQMVAHLKGVIPIEPYQRDAHEVASPPPSYGVDMTHILGQEHAKRALEVAAAGGHNLLMIGPPGAGKTLLARALPSILPGMSGAEALEVTRIYSVADLIPRDKPLVRERPFRSPHHTVSHAGLVGGGSWPRPGEITLAHRGVLFLDELPEFGPRILEVMRQPIEDKVVTISRARGALSFPANFMLVAAMNPCPCGYHGDPVHHCTCAAGEILRYRKRISGPLLDRIDLHIEVPRVETEKLMAGGQAEPSEAVRSRVEAARGIQVKRLEAGRSLTNSDMGPEEVRRHCPLDEAGKELLRMALERFGMSARAFHRVLKVARTIADLAGEEKIAAYHLAEAIQYRPKDGGIA